MSFNDTFNFTFTTTLIAEIFQKSEASDCETRSLIPNWVTYTFTALTTIILFGIFSVSIRNSIQNKQGKHDRPWSSLECCGKVKRVWCEFRDRKKLLGKVVAHLADQVTDLGVALEFYFLWRQQTCKEVSTFIFFILSMITFFGFRIISAIYIGIRLESYKHFILQLFDSEIYHTIYMSITKQKYQTFKVQEDLYLVEAITESVPQSMLQMVFLLQTGLLFSTDAKLINASLVFTVMSIIIKVSAFNFPDVKPKCNFQKFWSGKLYSAMNWNYTWVHLYQILLTTSTIFMIGLLWRIMGGMYLMVLFYSSLVILFIVAIVLFFIKYDSDESILDTCLFYIIAGCGLAIIWIYAIVCILVGVTYPEKEFIYTTHYTRIVIHIIGFLLLIIFGIIKFDSDNDFVPDYANRKLVFTANETELGLFVYIIIADILWIILFMILTERSVIQTAISTKNSNEMKYSDINKYKSPKEIIREKESIMLCNYSKDELMVNVLLYGNIAVFLKECQNYKFKVNHITFALQNSNTEDSRIIFEYFINHHSELVTSINTEKLNENVALLFNIHNLAYFKHFESFVVKDIAVRTYKYKENNMLHYACMNPDDTNALEFIKFLIETHKLDPNETNDINHLPLEILIINTNNWRSFKYLYSKTDKDKIYNKFWDIYNLCIIKPDKTMFNYLKSLEIDYNLVLYKIIMNYKEDKKELYNILSQLFENIEFFKYNLTTNKQTTPNNCYSFHIACQYTKLKIVQLFIKLDPLIINYSDKNNQNMLNYTQLNTHQNHKNEIIEYLNNLYQNEKFHNQSISFRNIMKKPSNFEEKENGLIQLSSLETKREFEKYGVKMSDLNYYDMKSAGLNKEEILEQQTLINALGKNNKSKTTENEKNEIEDMLDEQIQMNILEAHLDNLQSFTEQNE